MVTTVGQDIIKGKLVKDFTTITVQVITKVPAQGTTTTTSSTKTTSGTTSSTDTTTTSTTTTKEAE